MKRTLCLILTLLTLITSLSCALADNFRYSEREKALALRQFEACAFSAEYGGDGRNYTVRWEKPIAVYFAGDYTDEDLSFFFRFITELSQTVRGLPEIRLTTDQSQSNVQITFTTLDRMGEYVSNYTEGNWGYFTYWNMGSSISSLEIAIATDVTTQRQRNHLLMEEFVGGLGLANDHYLDDDSILYGEWTETQSLTTADLLMLCFLYDERISAGRTFNDVQKSIEKYY